MLIKTLLHIFLIAIFSFIFFIRTGACENMSFYYGDAGPPPKGSVFIGKTGIIMPLHRVLLARKGTEYCAIVFTKFWTGKTEQDKYASYESYCQADGSGDFSKDNIKFRREDLSYPKPRGIGRFAFSFGDKEIKCGKLKLFWSGEGAVHFYSEKQGRGDHGCELAPTNWKSVIQVDVFAPGIKWYKYDESRKRVNIPLNQFVGAESKDEK